MNKLTKILTGLTLGLAGLFVAASSALAITPTISIQKLPDYINFNHFDLSYAALTDDPASIVVDFYYNHEGGSYTYYASANGASGETAIPNSLLGVSNDEYCFKVQIKSTSASDTTCTIFDQIAPSAPGNYSKDRVDPSRYVIKWTNPGDDDFSRVFIYRGDEPGFQADGSHKIGEVGGAPNADESFSDNGLDPNKDYYYALRAIDKAGNSSGLVGDQGTETITTTPTPAGTTTVVVPAGQEQGGQVLSEETSETATPSPTPAGGIQGAAGTVAQSIQNHLAAYIIGAVILVILGFIGYGFFSKK